MASRDTSSQVVQTCTWTGATDSCTTDSTDYEVMKTQTMGPGTSEETGDRNLGI